MPSKRRVVAEDDEMELEEEEEEVGEKLFPYLSDVAVSSELNLPTQLSTLSSRKKRELLEYKRSHNEVSTFLPVLLVISSGKICSRFRCCLLTHMYVG